MLQDRFREMDAQQQLIAQKKREVEQKLIDKKRKEEEDAMSKMNSKLGRKLPSTPVLGLEKLLFPQLKGYCCFGHQPPPSLPFFLATAPTWPNRLNS